jgi:hypothetical protein
MLSGKHRLLPKPPEPPHGYMYFYRQLVPVTQVEQYARRVMWGFDGYSRSMRDTLNYGVIEPSSGGACNAPTGAGGRL